MKIIAISGSLREKSYNKAALEALLLVAPAGVEISIFDGVRDLPLFNPDMDEERVPAVEAMKSALGHANGLIIASPEYAHGISGVLKNALDWLVSGEEFVGMPVMLINASPRAHHAQEALREVVITMSGSIVERACLSVPLLGSGLDSAGILQDEEFHASLKSNLQVFCEEIQKRRA